MKKFVAVSLLIIAVLIVAIVIVANATGGGGDSAPEAAQTATVSAEPDYSNPPRSVSVEPAMLTVGIGESYTLRSAYDGDKPAAGAAYSVDRPTVLSVDASTGTVNGLKKGYAEVTATSFNNLTDKSYVTVKDAPTAITFLNAKVNMLNGESAKFNVEAAETSQGFSGAKFSSDNEDVATVSDTGVVTAKSEGSAVITAEIYNGKTARTTVTVISDGGLTEKTTIADSVLQEDAGWDSETLANVPSGSKVYQYGESADGRWLKVKCNDKCGWMYNKAFENVENFTDISVETLPVMADDLLFDIGRDKRAIFDYVYNISYNLNGDDTDENLCVEYFGTFKGSCYHHGAMLSYLYNRCGYETVRVLGKSSYDGVSEHSWCLSKTEDGWKHVDAQFFTIREADDQFFVDDYSQFFHWDTDYYPDTTMFAKPADNDTQTGEQVQNGVQEQAEEQEQNVYAE